MAITLDGPRIGPASGGAPAQLVILLHGLGADGNDLIDLAPFLAQTLPDAAFVSPNAPQPCDMAPYGYQWFSLQDRHPERVAAGVRAAAPVLDAFIDAELAEHGLTDDRLVLLGFSQGCMMALHVGLRRASPCASILGYSGRLVAADALAGEIRARPPVLLCHGTADPVVPFDSLRLAVVALRDAGVAVTAVERPGLGHGIDGPAIEAGAAQLARAFAA
jgi:phospholipase/carboxylesterase